ncbi:histidinol-phosphatase [Candidatus Gracilibacteria bacterium]|nr:histidinol-phosphatase [Candidatus Gracilibacteria bacterium]MCF7856570.1 histidinol-phosphatase [Candidatus Gracilibacteria bacterium]MCF7896882.1 histidinol-phosphatase [Candidatus Gracilibacteria bacterium]
MATWPDYIAEIDSLKKKYEGRIEILKGSEFDWLSLDYIDEWKKWRAETDWDYVIGSVHFLGKWGFDYLGDWEVGRQNFQSIEEIYAVYYRSITEMVESASDLFEIVGHFDLIKKFVKDVPPNATELALSALDVIAQTDLVMEINSAGWQKDCAEQYPSVDILRAAHERKIPITLNSDSHSTDRIAENFETSKELAKSVGYDEVVVFHQGGKRELIKI